MSSNIRHLVELKEAYTAMFPGMCYILELVMCISLENEMTPQKGQSQKTKVKASATGSQEKAGSVKVEVKLLQKKHIKNS